MSISDEKLSAFLDGELPEQEMDALRQQLAQDDSLTNRLAELAQVDELVHNSYSAIDQRPLPESVTALLKEDAPASAQVLNFPLWKRAQRGLEQHAAIAAAVALAVGFGLAQLQPDGAGTAQPGNGWAAISAGLDTTPSGIAQALDGDSVLTPRLSFVNEEGEYCRQFRVTGNATASESIACRDNGQWQLTATLYLDALPDAGSYQAASGGSLLDSTVDQLIVGEALDREAESAALANQWTIKSN